jgi:formate hydrogenlyase subunit 6/NADH:ubiquinone oxidoreductase subunit I
VNSSRQPLPIINSFRCTGCRACVETCPTNALVQRNDKAVLAYPDACTYCSACQDICPEDAIALPFLIVFKAAG